MTATTPVPATLAAPAPTPELPHHVAFHAAQHGAAVAVRTDFEGLPFGGKLWRYVYPDLTEAFAATAGHLIGGAPYATPAEAIRNLRALTRNTAARAWATQDTR